MPTLTPVRRGTTTRLTLNVSDIDSARFKPGGPPGRYLGTVTDLPSLVRYSLYARRCGLGCVCDAWARELRAEEVAE